MKIGTQSFGGGYPPLALACCYCFPSCNGYFSNFFNKKKNAEKIELSTKSKLRKPKSRTLGFLEIEDDN
jgi:hypothetical protein